MTAVAESEKITSGPGDGSPFEWPDRRSSAENEKSGHDHPAMTEALIRLAEAHDKAGRHDEAVRTYLRVLDICENVFAPCYGLSHFLSDLSGGSLVAGRIVPCYSSEGGLVLTPDLLLGSGSNRSCYAYPDDPDRIIKVQKPWDEGTWRFRRRRIKKALMPWLADFSSNREEARFYLKSLCRLGEVFYRHAPRCYGAVATTRGPGLVFERIRDHAGDYSETLKSFVGTHSGEIEHALFLLDELLDELLEAGISLLDWSTPNLLVRRDPVEGDRFVVIDWKSPDSPNDDLPLTLLSPYLARRKMIRHAREISSWLLGIGTRPEELRRLLRDRGRKPFWFSEYERRGGGRSAS